MPHFSEKLWTSIRAVEDVKLNKPATLKAIEAFEAKHKLPLPEAHREFLLQANGGELGVARLFGVGLKDGFDLGKQAADMRKTLEATAKGAVLPIAKDFGGSYFCYDLRKPPTAKGYPVLAWNHEYSEEPDDLPMLWEKVAGDFVAFVKKVIAV